MNLITTSMHSIPQDKIMSVSIGIDDKNPNLCALQLFLLNGQTLAIVYASKQGLIKLLKQKIDENWNNDMIFDVEKAIIELQPEINKLYPHDMVFYNFNSVDQLIAEVADYQQNRQRSN